MIIICKFCYRMRSDSGAWIKDERHRNYGPIDIEYVMCPDCQDSHQLTEKRKKQAKKYRQTEVHKTLSRQRSYKRRAIKLNATIGVVDETAIYKLCGDKCTYCGSKKKLGLDHIVALARGGAHSQENLTVACKSCNSSKGAKPLDERR